MHFTYTIWTTIVMVAFFIVIGAWLFVRALIPDPHRPSDATARQEGIIPARSVFRRITSGMRRYVGPISPDVAILTPLKRVALEFVTALCGFPGFGWLMSTRVAIGLPLLCIGPAIVYGFYPVLLALTGHITDSPLVAFRYLPALAVVSASLLAVAEFRRTKADRDEQ